MTENNYQNCDHCGKITTLSFDEGTIVWCGDCIKEDRSLLDTGEVFCTSFSGAYRWFVTSSLKKVKVIPKKTSPYVPTNKCDHCGKETSLTASKETSVIWCASCNKEDKCLLEALNLNCGTPEPIDQLWAGSKNSLKIKAIPKREPEEFIWPNGDWNAYPPCGHCGERRGLHHNGHCASFQGKARDYKINNTPLYIRGSAEHKVENGQRFIWDGKEWIIEPIKTSPPSPVYNVWMITENRWTSGHLSQAGDVYQHSTHPIELTYEQARAQADYLSDGIAWGENDIVVRELLPDGTPGKVIPKQEEKIELVGLSKIEEPKVFVNIDLSVKSSAQCDHCDKELPDCKLDFDQIAWCAACAKENATEFAKQDIPYFGEPRGEANGQKV